MEKLITFRLMWYLEKNKILSKEQSGFRNSRFTVDNLYIGSEIEKALKK